ncbi:DUF2842 domain-containing protein [Altererythrobacter sp. MTPC7]|uniref:DUF2842 domain-containing protein n=1 Tax=Altererythrobacter sp. MTPC7 TaxID=3056567 RepID=UPI0036F249E8
MSDEPTWRVPVGILGLILGLIVYALVVARYVPEVVGDWHAVLQTVVYLFFGLVWLLPLRRLLVWMEAGRPR